MPDKDVIEELKDEEYGANKLIKAQLQWLIWQVSCLLNARWEEPQKKRLGSIAKESTKIIWLKMIAHPISSFPDLVKVLKLWHKFNETLEDLLVGQENMFVMSLTSLTEWHLFDISGNLTTPGKFQLWRELFQIMCQFDEGDVDVSLLPTKHKSNNNKSGYDQQRNDHSPCSLRHEVNSHSPQKHSAHSSSRRSPHSHSSSRKSPRHHSHGNGSGRHGSGHSMEHHNQGHQEDYTDTNRHRLPTPPNYRHHSRHY